ncbi:uncharacterized protein [Elaeis guineensis]|uniref:uncharacterized protein n=1 Tax=Elaeis guineensis var. tenera TaxID=51953 RepID=UPI003C6CED52
MKVQVLANFIVECTIADDKLKDVDMKEAATPESDSKLTWMLHIDGASNAQGGGTGLILTNSKGVVTEYALQFDFKVFNNQAKYRALLAGLRIANELKIDNLKVFTDSQLIVGQVKGEFEARDLIMVKYLQKRGSHPVDDCTLLVEELKQSFRFSSIVEDDLNHAAEMEMRDIR